MSDSGEFTEKSLARVPSGLPGLDAILHGGFFSGGVYMVLAQPGSGKTILASQICFQHVAAGGRSLYVTLLTESHSRLIAALQTLKFFDSARLGESLTFVTGYAALEADKLKGLLALLRRMVRDHRATFLVIDGFLTAGSMAESEIETKKFIHELQTFVELVGCTTLFLTGTTPNDEPYALRTMVDGLLELRVDAVGMEVARTIEVSKFRGGEVLLGRHLFQITDDGLTIYPRTESLRGRAVERPSSELLPPASFGVTELDQMLGGGLRPGSVTMVLGVPGSGKTLLGLSLIATGAGGQVPGLYLGFSETPTDLYRKTEAIGLILAEHVKGGALEILWRSPLDAIADALAEEIFVAVRERGIRQVFIDGLAGFKDSLVYPERFKRFLGALFGELRSLGVVTVLSSETCSVKEMDVSERGLMAMLDNIIWLQHTDRDALGLDKHLSVVKMREGESDPVPRGFAIGARGFAMSVPPPTTGVDTDPSEATSARHDEG